jgi:hypothetical protein
MSLMSLPYVSTKWLKHCLVAAAQVHMVPVSIVWIPLSVAEFNFTHQNSPSFHFQARLQSFDF